MHQVDCYLIDVIVMWQGSRQTDEEAGSRVQQMFGENNITSMINKVIKVGAKQTTTTLTPAPSWVYKPEGLGTHFIQTRLTNKQLYYCWEIEIETPWCTNYSSCFRSWPVCWRVPVSLLPLPVGVVAFDTNLCCCSRWLFEYVQPDEQFFVVFVPQWQSWQQHCWWLIRIQWSLQ